MKDEEIAYLITIPKDGQIKLLAHTSYAEIKKLTESWEFKQDHGGEILQVVQVQHEVKIKAVPSAPLCVCGTNDYEIIEIKDSEKQPVKTDFNNQTKDSFAVPFIEHLPMRDYTLQCKKCGEKVKLINCWVQSATFGEDEKGVVETEEMSMGEVWVKADEIRNKKIEERCRAEYPEAFEDN